MKMTPFLLVSLFFSMPLMGQEVVPVTVLEAFKAQSPQVSNPFWEVREGAFVAMFKDDDGLKKVFFNDQGNWLETRTRVEKAVLPIGVQQFIDIHFATAEITYMGIVEQPEGTLYRVESEVNSTVVIKLLDKEGFLLDKHKINWSLNPNQ